MPLQVNRKTSRLEPDVNHIPDANHIIDVDGLAVLAAIAKKVTEHPTTVRLTRPAAVHHRPRRYTNRRMRSKRRAPSVAETMAATKLLPMELRQ